jgi:hypothetical protein
VLSSLYIHGSQSISNYFLLGFSSKSLSGFRLKDERDGESTVQFQPHLTFSMRPSLRRDEESKFSQSNWLAMADYICIVYQGLVRPLY